MIGRIRRAFRSTDEDPSWTGPGELRVPVATVSGEQSGESQPTGGVFVPYDTDEIQRQTELVRAAMAQGGRFGDREIPIPWLRRILAGLEGRPIDEEAMWEGIASPPRRDPIEESPTYQQLFPSPG